MIYGSVCSGIEAASVAWLPLGWQAAFVSEIDPFPRAVLAERFPETPLHGDFTTIGEGDYRAIDLLVGGTPCQDFSLAGLRAGMAGDRGNLTLEYLRLAERLRPRWLVWENVPGVLSSNKGRDFGAFLGGLVELGYGFAYRVLDAQHFGVPQRRRRVFVVGYLGDWRSAAAVLFERASLRRDHPPRRNSAEDIAGTIAGGARSNGGYSTDDVPLTAGTLNANGKAAGSATSQDASSGLLVAYGGNRQSGPIDVAAAVNAHGGPHGRLDFETETFVAQLAPALSASNPYGDHESREGLLVTHTLRAEGFDASEDGTGRGIPLVPMSFDTTQITSPANRSRPQAGEPCHTLAAGADAPAIAMVQSTADTLTAHWERSKGAKAGNQVGLINPIVYPSTVRRLTPRECERLQGFPDDYTLIRYRRKPAADGPRYKALGNSMAVPVMAWIGRRIEAVEQVLAEKKAA